MTTPRRTIAAVSYLNTIPFLYGIRHSEDLSAGLLLSPPSGCARAFESGEADIALVPVGALRSLGGLSSLSNYDIVTDWCIGASGPVRTVVLVSDVPLDRIERVWLDSHSMTSVRLAQVLAKNYWRISPEFVDLEWSGSTPQRVAEEDANWRSPESSRSERARRGDRFRELSVAKEARPQCPGENVGKTVASDEANERKSGDAWVLIGDKVFEHEGRFKYTWDLAVEWEKYAGLPFAFAVWVARKTVPKETLAALESALTMGVERVWEAIAESEFADRSYAYDYLTQNIDYFFDGPKRAALEKFLAENNQLKTTVR